MFDGFEQAKDQQSRKRWFASTGTSIVILIILGGVGVVLASQASAPSHQEPEIDVSFQSMPEEEAKKPPPPPPPPPKVQTPKAKRPGRPAPATVTAIPEERPSEAEPTAGAPQAEAFEEFGDGGELGGMPQDLAPPEPPPPPPPPLVEEKPPDPIQEIDPTFVQARPRSSNALPAYPEKMRHKGVEAEVVLKIRISDQGDVIDVKLVRGDEPFATAAIDAVKTWKYSPATDEGRPIASSRVVKIPFRLNAR